MKNNEDDRAGQGETTEKIFFCITGMSCPSCAGRVEEALLNCEGVKSVSVDFGASRATVELDSTVWKLDELKDSVKSVGYGLYEPGKKVSEAEREKDPGTTALWPYFIGVAASLSVVGFYLGLLTLTSDFHNAWAEFKTFAEWIVSLALGLGIQATLFSILRKRVKGRSMRGEKCSLAASGGMSTSAMAACCAHYLVTILPLIGLPFLSAAAAGLATYQTYFFMAGVLSSLFGIGLMLRTMKKTGIFPARARVN